MRRKPVYSLQELKEFAKDFDLKLIMRNRGYLNRPLNFQEAYLLGVYTLIPHKKELGNIFNEDKESIAKRSLAALCTLHTRATYNFQENDEGKYPAAEQIAGICAAIFDYDIGLSEKGFLNPKVPYAIDNCGMGGDIRTTPNVSTVSSLIAAASGIPMCKHGSPGNADRCGSSDFIALALEMKDFGDLIKLSGKKIEECIERFNFGYTEALDTGYKVIHLQTHEYAKLPHMNDIIGPITNPLDRDVSGKKIIGVNQLVRPVVFAQAYKILNEKGVTNLKEGMFLRGFVYADRKGPKNDDGMDELSTMAGGTLIARLQDGRVSEENLYARDFGLDTAEYTDIMPPLDKDGKSTKGPFSLAILKNQIRGPARDMILANAALIEHLARGTDVKEAYKKMKEVLDSNAPYENLLRIKEFLVG